jgi:hypothetical protein
MKQSGKAIENPYLLRSTIATAAARSVNITVLEKCFKKKKKMN